MANFGFISMAPAIAAVAAQITTVDGIVDDILVDTGETLPGEHAVIDGIVDGILNDTGTVIPTAIGILGDQNTALAAEHVVIDGIVDDILEDTGVTLQGEHLTLAGGLDILTQEEDQRKTPKMVCGTTAGTEYVNVLNITDKGFLTGIEQGVAAFTADGYANLKIIIDAVTIYDGATMAFTKKGDIFPASFNHRFNTSLQVQHKVTAADTGTIRTCVEHTTDPP